MQVNSDRIIELRRNSAWSQDELATALNNEGREGWRLSQVCAPIGAGGSTVSMIAILERSAN